MSNFFNSEYVFPMEVFTEQDLKMFSHQVDLFNNEITVAHNCLHLTAKQFHTVYMDELEFPTEIDECIMHYIDNWDGEGDKCIVSGGTDDMGKYIMVTAESGRCVKMYCHDDDYDGVEVVEIHDRYTVEETLVQLDIDIAYGDSEVEFRSLNGKFVPIHHTIQSFLEENGFEVENEYDLITYTSNQEIVNFLQQAESLVSYDFIYLKNVIRHG